MPIIVLSSRAGERGKVEALDLGADDYVTKPFGIAELVARIRTALRHRFQEQGSEPVFKSGGLSVDLVRRIVTVKGEEVKLSPKEYDILRLLVLHAGKVLTHRFLMQEVWGPSCDVQYLRIYVRQLRQKIETDPESPAHILTETGVGYRLRVQDGEARKPGEPRMRAAWAVEHLSGARGCKDAAQLVDDEFHRDRLCEGWRPFEDRRLLRAGIAGHRDERNAADMKLFRNRLGGFAAQVDVEHRGIAAALFDQRHRLGYSQCRADNFETGAMPGPGQARSPTVHCPRQPKCVHPLLTSFTDRHRCRRSVVFLRRAAGPHLMQ